MPVKPTLRPGRKQVLIVDDSRVVRERLVDLLSDVSQVQIVGEAGTAADAIQQVRKLRPTVVVLDISMPGGNGFAVLQEIRRSHPSATVIMLTNLAQDQYREKCMTLGANYFFDKSTEFAEVRHVLEHLDASAESGPAATNTTLNRTPLAQSDIWSR